MPDGPAYVIVGASLAGAKAAETLREEGFDGTVVLVGQEAERPYERPPLSKGFLLGKAAKSSIYVHEDSWYPAHGVDLLLCNTVTAIDRTDRRVELADGSATGSC
jgi:3-phenylpropionate/trans-cinnamate dioxygenase ferredoxin reductase subunit